MKLIRFFFAFFFIFP
ncbi:hypothetical protein HUP73_004209 [Salmonella enterica subsp. enterica serovar 4,[5],12:i:-]|nr:hypothetical protein [Salmonella enterica subsp. enterica serovar 4,[5],12:i:-]EGT8508866.1 hypothetical protein [Salmonella enterica]EJO3729623.1 pheA operon leader peptide PheL [Salmonella enterica]EJY5577363.1 pheA operon leader peptide PheL [Salmonella enterica]